MTEPIDQATKVMSNTDGEDTQIKKYPDFPQWLQTDEGKECLAWPISESKYLHNRLFWAFDAGRNCVWQQYTRQKEELASLREQLAKKEELITSIRHKLYDRDTDDAIIHEIGQLLTEGGYPYETED